MLHVQKKHAALLIYPSHPAHRLEIPQGATTNPPEVDVMEIRHNSFAFQVVHSTPSSHAYGDLWDTVLLSNCPFVTPNTSCRPHSTTALVPNTSPASFQWKLFWWHWVCFEILYWKPIGELHMTRTRSLAKNAYFIPGKDGPIMAWPIQSRRPGRTWSHRHVPRRRSFPLPSMSYTEGIPLLNLIILLYYYIYYLYCASELHKIAREMDPLTQKGKQTLGSGIIGKMLISGGRKSNGRCLVHGIPKCSTPACLSSWFTKFSSDCRQGPSFSDWEMKIGSPTT